MSSAAFAFTINGSPVMLEAGSLSYSDSIGQRSTGSALIADFAGTSHYVDGQPWALYDVDGLTLLYSGVLLDATEQNAVPTALLAHSLNLADWHYAADKRYAAVGFTNTSAGGMVGTLVTDYLLAEGVYAVRNLLTANQSDVETDTTGFTALNSTTLTRDTSQHWHGAASLKAVTPGSVSNEGVGVYQLDTSYVGGQRITGSVYLRGSGTVILKLVEHNFAQFAASAPITLTTTWTRYQITATLPSPLTGGHSYGLEIATPTTQAITFYADGLQVEPSPVSTVAQPWELGGTSSIAAGPTIIAATFNYAQVSACIDAIAKKANYFWWIDPYCRLWFQQAGAILAPFSVTDADMTEGTIRRVNSNPLYRNRQYVTGISAITSAQTETRKGDGATRAFVLSYPLNSVPSAISVNGSAKTLGIKGVDSGKDFYWSKGSDTITQDSGATLLISTDTLSVTYIGQYSAIVQADDLAGQLARKAIEAGGTGIVEDAQALPSGNSIDEANQLANGLLQRFSVVSAYYVTFDTLLAGIAPGQMLTATIPAHGITVPTALLVESVSIADPGSDTGGSEIAPVYSVKALAGPVDSTWVDWFSSLYQRSGNILDTISVGLSGQLTISISESESWTWTESVTETAFTCPICNTSTFCGAGTIVC